VPGQVEEVNAEALSQRARDLGPARERIAETVQEQERLRALGPAYGIAERTRRRCGKADAGAVLGNPPHHRQRQLLN
jgi:hypothetical protein